MEDIKVIIGKNLAELRKRKKYTQLDLANILQYSDKSISKWEKGDSLPDIEVLYNICNLYGVTLDYLTHEGNYSEKKEFIKKGNKYTVNKKMITLLSGLSPWFIATLVFVFLLLYANIVFWPVFVWAIPLTFLLLLVFNCIWGGKKARFVYISGLTWTIFTGLFLQLLYLDVNIWPIFLIGIPAQIAIIFSYGIKKRKKPIN